MSGINKIQFDAFCDNSECIQNNKGLFRFVEDTYHCDEKVNRVKAIIPKQLNALFDVRQKNHMQNQINLESIHENITMKINLKIGQIMKIVVDQFFKDLTINLHQYIEFVNINNVEELIVRLKNGDHQILKKKKQYQALDNGKGFSFFLKESILQKQIQIQKNVQQIGNNLIQIIQAFNTQSIKSIMQEFHHNCNCEEDQQYYNAEQNRMFLNFNHLDSYKKNCNQNEKMKYIERERNQSFQFKRSTQKIQMEPNEIQSNQHIERRKIIKKEKLSQIKRKQMPNNKNNHHKSKYQSINLFPKKKLQQNESPIKNIMFDKQTNQLNVLQTNRPNQTLLLLAIEYSNIQAINIFDSRFANKQIIIKLFKTFTKMKRLTFNCNHCFDASILKQLEQWQIIKITLLQLKWGFDKFFNNYTNYQYFSQKQMKDLIKSQSIDNLTQIYNKFVNSQSLFFQNNNQFRQLHQKGIFKNIKVLHLVNSKNIQFSIRAVAQSNQFRNITTLNLQRITVSLNDDIFKKFIQNNKKLKTIKLICIKLIGKMDNVLLLFSSLSELQQLAIQPDKQQQLQITPSILFNLVHLRSLNLLRILFISANDVPTDSSCLADIRKMSKLTHLGLLNCWPVCNDLFKYLQQGGILQQIKFLGLSASAINNQCRSYLPKMTNLQQLDLQEVNISGEMIAQALEQFYLKNSYNYSKLKYLNANQNDDKRFSQKMKCIDDCINGNNDNKKKMIIWRHSLRSIKKIAEFAPNLIYLNIEKCYNLENYDFSDFKSLKILCVDSKLDAKLPQLPKTMRKYVGLMQ